MPKISRIWKIMLHENILYISYRKYIKTYFLFNVSYVHCEELNFEQL